MPDPTDPVGRLVAYLGSLIASKSRGEHLPVGATRRELADHRARVLAIASSPADVPTLKSCLDAVQAAVEGMLAAPDDGPKAERATQEAETALAGLYDLLPVSRAAVASAGTPEGKQGEGGKPPAGRSKGVSKAEAEIRVREWLARNAKDNPASITRDAVAAGAGVSGGQVSNTAAWKAFRERRDQEAKPVAREVPLTDAMKAVVPADCDTPEVLAALIEEQRKEEAEENRRHKRRHEPS